MNKLRGLACYAIGPMDRAPDGGVGWREDIGKFLRKRGVKFFNPCDKPCDMANENSENREYRAQLKQEGRWDELASLMKEIRAVDLRLVDKADFMVVNLDMSLHPVGSFEEIFWANRMKRPVLIYCPQGKASIADWLFAVLPHEMFFDSWADLKIYLHLVDTGKETRTFNRWIFWDYSKMEAA